MANDRQLVVRVISDTKSLERGLKRSETQLQKFGRTASGVASAGGLSGGIFAVGRGGVIAAGIGATVLSLKSVVGAAAESQQILGQTRVALEDAGLSWDRYGKRVEGAAASMGRLGFDDEETLKVIAAFARGTGDVDKALKLTSLSANVARARYIDLASAATIVGKANLGNAGALRRLNIDAKAGATSTQLLTLLQQKYGSAAEAAAGDAITANDRLRVSLGNVKEQIGSGLLPVTTSFAEGLSDAADDATRLVEQLQRIKVPGGDGKGFGSTFAAAFGDALFLGPKVLHAALAGSEAQKVAEEDGKAFGERFGLAALAAAGTAMNNPPPAFGQPGFKPGKAPAVPAGPTAGQRNQWFDAGIARQLDRVEDVKTISGQVTSLQAIAAGIQKRIDATKDITRKLNLEDQLVAVQRQTRGLKEQQASDALATAQEARERERQRRQAEIERRAAALQARTARQSRALGLSADGTDIVPGAANLRKQLASLTGRVDDSKLGLSSKLKSQLVGARKVLNGEFGAITKDSRSRIQELFATIRGEFEKGGKGPLTNTSGLNTKKVIAGLGLSPQQTSEIRGRLSGFNTAGRALAAGGVSQPIVVEAHTTVQLDGHTVGKSVTRSQQKTRQRNPAQRRGPNRGAF